MTDTSNLVGGTEANPELVAPTPAQAALTKQVQFDKDAAEGSSRNPYFARLDTSPAATMALDPNAITIGTDGKPYTGPFVDPSHEDDYRKRVEQHNDAEQDRLVQEVNVAAKEEEEAETQFGLGGANIFPTVMPVVADVGMGIIESPKAAAVGTIKAVNAFAELGKQVDDWARTTPLYAFQDMTNDVFEKTFADDKDGIVKSLASFILKAPDAATGVVKDVTESEASIKTNTGNLVKGVSQFLFGFLGVGKFAKGFKASGAVAGAVAKQSGAIANAAKSGVQGAIAQFAVFDGQEKNLSNLIQSMPGLANPINEFLAVSEETPELVGRLKSTLEGFLTGVVADGVIMGVRAIRQARKLRAEESAKAQAAGTTDPTLPPEQLAAQSAKIEADVAELLKPRRTGNGTRKLNIAAGEVGRQRAGPMADELVDPGQAEVIGLQRNLDDIKKERVAAEEAAAKPDADPALAQKIDDLTTAEAQATADLNAAVSANGQTPNIFNLKIDTFETGDDIKVALLRQTEKNAKAIDEVRRGVQEWEQTGKNADALNAAVLVAERRRGQAFNAEESLAVRQMLIASEEKTVELAKLVQAEPGNTAAAIALRRSMSTTYAILKEAMGARAEAGRALQAWRIPAGSSEYAGLDLEAMLRESGGMDGAQDLAKKLLDMKAKKGGTFAMASGWEHVGSSLKMIYTNGLLSGPTSAVINVVGNTAAMIQDVVTRAVVRTEAGVTEHEAGEAAAILTGYMEAMKDAFKLSAKETAGRITMDRVREAGPFRALAPGLDDAMVPGVARGTREESGRNAFNAPDPRLERPLSAAAFNLPEHSALGRVADFSQMLFESPSNLNALGDDFFATVAARGELHAQATRQAVKDLRAQGIVTTDPVYAQKLAEAKQGYIDEPTKDMLGSVESQVKELTFSRSDGGGEQVVQKARKVLDSAPGLPFGTAVLPFVRTPMNLMSYAIRNSPMAPLSMRWQAAMAAGGAEQELALTQFALGTALWGIYMEAHASGTMTGAGPRNRAQRDAMMRSDTDGGTDFQPYSVKVDGRWYAYDRADPVGQNMAISSDFMNILANKDWDASSAEEGDEQIALVVGAMGVSMMNKATLKGTFDTVEALTSNNTAIISQELNKRAVAFVPFSSLFRSARRVTDPTIRETSDTYETLRNSIPGLSGGLAASYDLWGNERTYQSGLGVLYDIFSPIKTKKAGGSSVDLEILDNGVSIQLPQRAISVGGVSVSLKNHPEIYADLVKTAGQPALEYLKAVIDYEAGEESERYYSYTTGPNGERAIYLKQVVEDFRKAAREVVIERHGNTLNKLVAEKIARVDKRAD